MSKINLYAASIFSRNPSVVWALDEDFYSVDPQTQLPLISGVAVSAHGLQASAYGANLNPGYYLSSNMDTDFDDLKANNYGVPLVYGASSSTNLYPNPVVISGNTVNEPSLILPGLGLLNKEGKSKDLTLEFWIRILSTSHFPRRVVGPIGSADGLYVNGPFLSLKIGDTIGHHYVGDWGRPMLVDLYYTEKKAGVFVNSEEVITILPTTNDILDLPEKYNDSDLDQDWIGFYAYENVSPINIDCVAIYPYVITQDLARVNYVKGQAVEEPEKKNSSYSSSPIAIDYAYSKNAATYSYPGIGSWQHGIASNMARSYYSLSAPTYALPTPSFSSPSKTLLSWYEFQKENQDPVDTLDSGVQISQSSFFRMTDKDIYNTESAYLGGWDSETYLAFDSFNVITDDVYSIYATVELPSQITKQTLFKIFDDSGRSFEIYTDSDTSLSTPEYNLVYAFKLNGAIVGTPNVEEISPSSTISIGAVISDLPTIVGTDDVSSLFANRRSLKMYFGGSGSYLDTFTGKVYRIGLCNKENHNTYFAPLFSNGKMSHIKFNDANLLIGSYTLFGNYTFNSYVLDVATNGYFVDYAPMKTLAKSVKNSSGEDEDQVDFIQFDIDFPDSGMTAPMVKTYVRFVNLTQLDAEPEINTSSVSNGLLTPANDSSVSGYKYLITTNRAIAVPDAVKASLSLYGFQVYVESFIPGINRNPLAIKKMTISSYAIDKTADSKTPIGTRYGRDLYQFSGTSYNVPTKYVTGKDSVPYIYLDRHTGIRNVGTLSATSGIEVPVNRFKASKYIVSVLQFSAMYKTAKFGVNEQTIIMQIDAFTEKNEPVSIRLYASGNDSQYGTISAKIYNGSSYQSYTNLSIHINGVEFGSTATNAISVNEWAVISISFTDFLYFNENTGYLKLVGPMLINNISDHQLMPYQVGRSVVYRSWQEVADIGTWGSFTGSSTPKNWYDDVWVAGTLPVDGLSLENIYNSYFGSSAIIGNNLTNELSFSPAEKVLVNGKTTAVILKKPV